MKLLLKAAKIIDKSSPYHLQTKDILIEKGIISKIEDSISEAHSEIIQLEDLHISQGWFDTSVCFGEPGFEERETIDHGLQVAAKSGFTAVAINPNTNPVSDNKAVIELMINKAQYSATNIHPIGAFTNGMKGEDMAELFDMQNSGAIAFGDYNKAISNPNLLKIGLLYTQNFNGLLISFPQENRIAGSGLVNEEVNSTQLGLKGIPALAEEIQIVRDLFLVEYTEGKLHIPTISTKKSVELIKEAKSKCLDITCSVSAHHLTLTDNEIKNFDANNKVLPPLRTQKDCDALIEGVKDGTIDMITSDHNPIDIEHKKMEYNNAKFGSIGLESLFGSLNQVLPLEVLVENLSEKPKKRFNIEVNPIKVGNKAELSLFTPTAEYIFSEEDILSSSKNSIFMNKKMIGKAYGIIANNQVIL
ncbi:dihydroorotase [Lutibacter sp. TH_r2]|uniref:dihydroorotase n=1 Tax=Lutibacter sp. TH_r2 TaxID=3082083 RepID=UPI002955BA6B|nr:dihydroorotase [Lutibacter sp. TH_r2]MDV7188127.1 dihydroorotase [Lutibacter sp. TH_r2]